MTPEFVSSSLKEIWASFDTNTSIKRLKWMVNNPTAFEIMTAHPSCHKILGKIESELKKSYIKSRLNDRMMALIDYYQEDSVGTGCKCQWLLDLEGNFLWADDDTEKMFRETSSSLNTAKFFELVHNSSIRHLKRRFGPSIFNQLIYNKTMVFSYVLRKNQMTLTSRATQVIATNSRDYTGVGILLETRRSRHKVSLVNDLWISVPSDDLPGLDYPIFPSLSSRSLLSNSGPETISNTFEDEISNTPRKRARLSEEQFKMEKQGVRAYKFWDGENKFFCDGNFIVGPDWYKALMSFLLIVIPTALFLAVPAMYFVDEQGNPALLVISSILMILSCTFLIIWAITDPGYLPSQKSDQLSKGPTGAPLVQNLANKDERTNFDFAVRGHVQRIKYWATCYIFRPPRTSHCVVCDACVERFDHHCPWVGNCVAKRNYKYFMFFLLFTSLHSLVILITCCVHLKLVSDDEGVSKAIEHTVITCLLIFYSFGFFGFTMGMFCFHMYLVLQGLTTYEKLKHTWDVYNPFDKPSCCSNIIWKLCAPRFPKWFQPTRMTEIEPTQVVENPRNEAFIEHELLRIKDDNRLEIVDPTDVVINTN